MSSELEVPAREPAASADEAAPSRNARSRDFDQELGAKLRAARVSAGMNQTALGKAIGVSFQQVQKYESGRDRIAAGTLQKLGEVLRIHPGEFFGKTTAPVGVAELCYEPDGCAEVLERCAREIDARTFCLDGPEYFPRLVQHAVWRFCAEGGLGICNGNQINDRIGCLKFECPLSDGCARLPPL